MSTDGYRKCKKGREERQLIDGGARDIVSLRERESKSENGNEIKSE